jgi:Cd2+/Zn2+-exporting ATPase
LQEKEIETAEIDKQVLALEHNGHTVVIFGDQKRVWALVTILDGIRPEAVETASSMRREGVEKIVILTGDNEVCARELSARIGADQVHANVLPHEKVAAIENLKSLHKFVAMVGDGVNDVPAMASATIGIALGVTGTDAALETAGIVLMSGDISKLPYLLRHSRTTLRIIKQNVAFALGAKLAFLGLALLGWVTLWMAITADSGAIFVVTLNGLRLLRSQGNLATATIDTSGTLHT